MTIKAANGYDWLASPDVVWSNGKNPKPLSNVHNILLALKEEPGLRDMFMFNEFAFCPTLIHPINQPICPDFAPRELTDEDVVEMQDYLQTIELKNASKSEVFNAIQLRARDAPFHPVKEYFSTLTWDGINRLDTWLTRCAGAEHTAYNTMVGRKFIIGMVKRILHPGCKMDYMIVLEGPQGIMKSTLCRTLVGDNWFTDHLPEIGTKDAQQALSGVWLIEVAELHAFSKLESAHLKSFISRQEERYRVPYAKLPVVVPRQCVFAGTTNKNTYLKDETGGRRFWPVRVTGKIDIEDLDRTRDQLFAEAVHWVLEEDEDCYPPADFEREFIVKEQNARYDEDVWQEKIATYLETLSRTSVADILTNCLYISTERQGRREQFRVVNILENLGWTIRRGTGGVRHYFPPGHWKVT